MIYGEYYSKLCNDLVVFAKSAFGHLCALIIYLFCCFESDAVFTIQTVFAGNLAEPKYVGLSDSVIIERVLGSLAKFGFHYLISSGI